MIMRGTLADRSKWIGLCVSGAALAFVAGCGGHPSEVEIAVERQLSSDAPDKVAGAEARFRFFGPDEDDHTGHDHPPGQHPGEETGMGQGESENPFFGLFDYDVPSGWLERDPSGMRIVDLVPQGEPTASVTVIVLAGAGGGIEANVNRWRGQVGLAPATNAELNAMPSTLLLGQPAYLVDLAGRFTGMGDADVPDARLLGVMLNVPTGDQGVSGPLGIFVKFTGPRELVDAEQEAFEFFYHSLRVAEDVTEEGENAGTGQLTYSAPEGWTDEGARGMRVVDLAIDGADLSVIPLELDGGGALDNVNRWRGQLGLGPTTAEGIEAMERVPVLGAQAYLFDETGSYQGMLAGDSIPAARMLGALVIGAERSYFIKFVGPEEVVDREEDTFRVFLDSLEVGA